MKTYTELDEVLAGDKKNVIARIYKIAVKNYTQDGAVKIQMTKWAENINRVILMEKWEFFWNQTLKITGCSRIKANSIKNVLSMVCHS